MGCVDECNAKYTVISNYHHYTYYTSKDNEVHAINIIILAWEEPLSFVLNGRMSIIIIIKTDDANLLPI